MAHPPVFKVKVVGYGAKYAKINGEMVPFVSRSATDRLRDGEDIWVYMNDGYLDVPYWNVHLSEFLKTGIQQSN